MKNPVTGERALTAHQCSRTEQRTFHLREFCWVTQVHPRPFPWSLQPLLLVFFSDPQLRLPFPSHSFLLSSPPPVTHASRGPSPRCQYFFLRGLEEGRVSWPECLSSVYEASSLPSPALHKPGAEVYIIPQSGSVSPRAGENSGLSSATECI